MTKWKTRCLRIVLATVAAAAGSCTRDFDFLSPNQFTVSYESSWQSHFGTTDEEQTWNSAQLATARIGLGRGHTVRIYTENPLNSKARLLAKTLTATDSLTLKFDVAQETTMVFVTAEDADGMTINGYLPLADGEVAIVRPSQELPTAVPTTIGQAVVRPMRNPWQQDAATGVWQQYQLRDTLYRLNDVVATPGTAPWKASDMDALFGSNGLFAEQQDNLQRHDGRWTGDVAYTMLADGPVRLTMAYCQAGGTSQIGYYYWRDGEDPARARKLLLTSQAPHQYIGLSYDGGSSYEPMPADADVLSWHNNSILVRGTTFSLVYFDAQNRASYTFPQGTHIGFFIDRDGSYEGLASSLPGQNAHSAGGARPERAATYSFRGNTVLGFEVGSDYDLNDIVLLASGRFARPADAETGLQPTADDDHAAPLQWVLACEDMDQANDFDFNDIVFSVSHVGGQPTATITPLAAGGTSPANIMLAAQDLGEVHTLLLPGIVPDETNNYVPLNTTSRGSAGEPIVVSVATDFSMAYDAQTRISMGNFSVCVLTPDERTGGQRAVTIGPPAPGTTPQMLLVPGTWLWPTEGSRIDEAYPSFAGWNGNALRYATWYKDEMVGSRIVR